MKRRALHAAAAVLSLTAGIRAEPETKSVAPTAAVQAAPNLPPLPIFDRFVLAKLHAGIVVTDSTDDGGHGGKARGYAVCHCGVASVWAVITNHGSFTEFVPRVTGMEISRHTDRGERALQTIDATISTVKYALDYRWDPATRHIDYQLAEDVPHDLKAVQGSWQLWPIDQGEYTLIEYNSAVDSGRQIPGFIRDYLADRGVQDLLNAICKRSEGPKSTRQN